MTTNILAVITFLLTTNVTEEFSDFAKWEPETPKPNEMGIIYGFDPPRLTKGVDPQTKFVTTEVKKLTTLNFNWAGAPWAVTHEETLSKETVRMAKGWSVVQTIPVYSFGPLTTFTNILWNAATNSSTAELASVTNINYRANKMAATNRVFLDEIEDIIRWQKSRSNQNMILLDTDRWTDSEKNWNRVTSATNRSKQLNSK